MDTSVFLDVFGAGSAYGERSREALRQAYRACALVACEVAWAEVHAHFATIADHRKLLNLLGVRFDPMTREAAELGGQLWREHRARTGSGRSRVAADFLVGSHARVQADARLTRGRGFYRACFRGLRIIDPSS